jgi:polysaccharide deactylase WbmS-like protein
VTASQVVLTFDVDWAPDFAIDAIADELVAAGVRSTWMITHSSPAVDRLRGRPDLFELGIHPNFLPGSTHGETPEAVLDHCMALVPGATTMRTHALFQSSLLMRTVLERTPVRCDASLFLLEASHVAPVGFPGAGGSLVRVPYVWEDDIEMLAAEPTWSLDRFLARPGLQVLDFHPMLVWLNAPDMAPYRRLTDAGPLADTPLDATHGLVAEGPGPRTFLAEVIEHLADAGSRRVCDVAAGHREGVVA